MKVGDIDLPLHNYTLTGQERFGQFVSNCGGIHKASVKLDVPSFFVEQVLRNEPVPDHVLDSIEQKVGPIRLIDHTASISNIGSLRKLGDTLKTVAESESTLKEFVVNCGSLLAASFKLGVSTSTIQKLLSGMPVSGPTITKVFAALKVIDCSTASGPPISPLSKQHSLFEMSGLPESPTHQSSVYPLTIRELQERLTNSETTRHKLGISPEEDAIVCAPDHAGANSFSALKSKLREIVKSDIDMFNLASKLGVTATSLRKIYDGIPVSSSLGRKVAAALRAPNLIDLANKPSAHAGTNSTSTLKTRLREIVKSDVDMFNLASKLGVTATSLRKIYDGIPVSISLAKKAAAALRTPNLLDLVNKPSDRVERLQAIYNLYKQVGTLEAVGKQVGVTRERVRQLLTQGDRIGLFEYNPREYPFISKDKIIEDYKKTLSLSRVARLNNISTSYLHELFTAYSITVQDLADYCAEGRRARCIEQYKNLVDKAGHHLTTTELQSTSEGHALHTRINRNWGTINAFREAFNIPTPPQGSPSFRKDTEQWREHRQQVALVSRMQQLDQLREYLNSHDASGSAEIAVDCGLRYQRGLRLLGLLVRAGEVRKIGHGSATKYILALK